MPTFDFQLDPDSPVPSLDAAELNEMLALRAWRDECKRLFPKMSRVLVNHPRGQYVGFVVGYEERNHRMAVQNEVTGKVTPVYPNTRARRGAGEYPACAIAIDDNGNHINRGN